MKKLASLPCWPGWVCAVGCMALTLIPDYFYARLMPLLVGLVIAAYCLVQMLKKKKPTAARLLQGVITSLVILGALIGTVTGGLILYSSQGEPEADCPYILVLGAQVRPEGPSETLQERIDAAYTYLHSHPETIAIVSGGKGDDEHISEALCMAQELTRMGIGAERIWLEDRSTSTQENISYSLDLIEQRTGSRPSGLGVVSSEFHLFRVGMQAQEQGLSVRGIPAETCGFDRYLHYFIREIAGVWHFILLGGE